MGKRVKNSTIYNNDDFVSCSIVAYVYRLVLFVLLYIPCITPILLSSSASAINSSITLNLSSSTLSLDLTPKLGGGFAKSGNNTINVKTNHYTGYTLKITAGTNDTNSTKLVNIESNTTIDSIESNVSEADFSANTDAAATSYNGKWGFMPSQYVTTDNTNPSSPVHTIVDNDPTGSNASNAVYLPAPDYATGTTLDITNSANPDTFNTYTISLGARAGMETTAGTYSNTFNILAIGNPIIYSITFSDNTGDSSITNLPTGTGSVSTSDIDILLPTTVPERTGYDFIGWCKTETTTNGTVCPSNTPYPASVPAAGQTPAVPSYYEIDQTTDNTELTFYATWAPKQYTITLDRNGGDAGSTSTSVTYGATTLGAITVPTRSNTTDTRTVSGFTNTTSATNATVSSTTTLNSTSTTTYTFNGWYKESAATNQIANTASTPALNASTSYTNSSKQWTSTSGQTLYAGWTSSTGAYNSVTLPTITRTGSTCGWSTSSTATTITYASGAGFTPTGNTTLYGVCYTNLSLNANGGTGGSSSATVNYGATTLSTISNPTRANSTGTRTISGLLANGTNASGATVTFPSSGNCTSTSNCKSTNTTTYTFNGWYKESGATNKIASNATTPALQASTTYTNASSQWTYTTAGALTLYAGWTASAGAFSSITLPTITKTGYTCGWDTNQSATNPTYASGGSLTPNGNITLYGICKADTYTITLNGNGATNSYTTSTTATYNATTLAAIATLPTKSSTTGTRTISGFTLPSGNNAASASITWPSSGCTSSSNCSSTNTTTYTFNGWHASSGTGTLVASSASTPVLQASTSYTDASGKWTSTSAQTLYAGWNTSAGAYSSVTLPQITKTGHTCGWTTTSTGATSITYASGGSLTPTANTTLYGVCTVNKYSLTINFAGTGVSSVQVRTASGTGGTLMGTVSTSGGTVSNLTYGTNYYLYPTFTTGNVFGSWAKTSGEGSISSTTTSNPYYTIGAGNGAVTITGKDECAGYICYNANGTNVVGTMGKQSVTDGGSVDLLASNFSRTGYGFAGWSDKSDYATNSSAKFYGPQETITVPTGTNQNGFKLYAVWIASAGSLQTNATAVCNSLTKAPTDGTANLSSVSALTDQRDNNTYAIAKLADGNCWMIENLRLESTAAHNSDGTLAQGYGTSAIYGNFGGLASAENENFTDSTTANSLYYSGTQSGTASINISTTDSPGYRMPRYNNLNTTNRATNPTSNTFPSNNTTGGMYSYGNYYTWHAAIANTTQYSGHFATDADGKTSETVNTSLCPTGWRLPYGSNTDNGAAAGGFYNLNYKINNDSNVTDSTASLKLRSFPNNFLYSGYFYTSSIRSSARDRGSYGYYWSSTALGNYSDYSLLLNTSAVSPGTNSGNKSNGQSIRCTLGS